MARAKNPTCLACRKPLRRYRWRNESWASGKEYGGYGDNYFCGRTCGYDFALVMVEKMKEGSLIKNPEAGQQ